MASRASKMHSEGEIGCCRAEMPTGCERCRLAGASSSATQAPIRSHTAPLLLTAGSQFTCSRSKVQPLHVG